MLINQYDNQEIAIIEKVKVTSLLYLGVLITDDSSDSKEVDATVVNGDGCLCIFNSSLKSKVISCSAQLRI